MRTKLVWLFGAATFLGAIVYTVISLNRWEWNRALFFGLVAVVAEIGLATGVVCRKLDQLVSRRDDTERREIRDTLRATRHPHAERFAWLRPEEVVTRSNVFITMLVGGGIVVSALTWVIDRVAARTSTSLREGNLADDLRSVAYPDDGLLVDDVAVLAQTVPHFDDPQLRALLRRP